MRLRNLAILAAAVGAAFPAGAAAAPLPADATAILSGTTTLDAPLPTPAGDSRASSNATSQDGRFVAFSSVADGLVDGDDDAVENIYVKDLQTGAVELASRATGAGGEPAHARCHDPAISDDGQRVAFTCEGSLDPADTNTSLDVYVRDVGTDTTVLVSRVSGLGAVGDSGSYAPVLSEGGRYVAFTSRARNLAALGTNDERVYRREIGAGDATILVSRKPAASGDAPWFGTQPSIDDSGDRVAFVMPGFAAVDPADTNGLDDVYVRDIPSGTVTLVSRADGNGDVGNGHASAPALSGNGDVVAWDTTATNFVAEDTEPGRDVYRRSLTAKTTALVSVNFDGAKGDNSTTPSIDDGGWLVAFVSAGTTLDPADSLAPRDAYLKDMEHGGLQLLSRRTGDAGTAANAFAPYVALSGDGRHAAVALGHGITPDADPHLDSVIMRDVAATPDRTVLVSRPAGDAPFANAGGAAGQSALSADGRFAAFVSRAPGLGLPDDVDQGVFRRDRVTGAVTLVSREDGASGAPMDGTFYEVDISADGKRIAFSEGDNAEPEAVWVRDVTAGQTFLASRADGATGAQGAGYNGAPALDADGSRVAFVSSSPGLAPGDDDTIHDILVRDLETSKTILASRAGAVKDDEGSLSPDLSADGNLVAFTSSASKFPGAGNFYPQAYVRDLAGGTTRHVSTVAADPSSPVGARNVSIDAAGDRIAYGTPSTKGFAPGEQITAVFAVDLPSGTVTLASRADGAAGEPADGNAYDARISPDGGSVVFASEAPNLGATPGVEQVYRRDLARGRTTLVSRESGPGGAPMAAAAQVGGASDGGACVSFTSAGATRVPQVYLRAVTAECVPPAGDGGGGGNGGDGPGGGGGDGGGTATDTTPPAVTGLRMTRARFAVGRAGTARVAAAARRGSAFVFRLGEDARTAIAIKRCRGVRCARTVAKLSRARTHAGRNRVAFTGRIGRKALRPGRYRATVTATDRAGNVSAPRTIRFRIVRR